MEDCEQIIINCDKGMQRAPMIASRLVALLQHGINKPCKEVYEVYAMICKNQCIQNNLEWNPNNTPCKWPKLCTAAWTQNEICMFQHRKQMYPKTTGEIVEGLGVYLYIEYNMHDGTGNESKSDPDEFSESSETIPFPLPSGIDDGSNCSATTTTLPLLPSVIAIVTNDSAMDMGLGDGDENLK
jgi:hypothetical protein